MSYYIPKPDAFKHCTYGKYKIDFYKSTAIIKWTDKVGDDYDEKTSYKTHKRAISDRLKNNVVLDNKFILLTEKSPKDYTGLPAEREDLELYLHFKEKMNTKKKKDAIANLLRLGIFN